MAIPQNRAGLTIAPGQQEHLLVVSSRQQGLGQGAGREMESKACIRQEAPEPSSAALREVFASGSGIDM